MILKGKRIFILEDNANNLNIATIILEQAGAAVQFDRYGQHTITRLQEFLPVDLILMDLMLPHGATAYDILNRIRAVPELAHIPVAALTASDPGDVTTQLKAAGFCGFISKPVRFQTLGVYVDAILHDKSVWGTSHPTLGPR